MMILVLVMMVRFHLFVSIEFLQTLPLFEDCQTEFESHNSATGILSAADNQTPLSTLDYSSYSRRGEKWSKGKVKGVKT